MSKSNRVFVTALTVLHTLEEFCALPPWMCVRLPRFVRGRCVRGNREATKTNNGTTVGRRHAQRRSGGAKIKRAIKYRN